MRYRLLRPLKKPCKSTILRGRRECIRNGGRTGSSARLARAALSDELAKLRIVDRDGRRSGRLRRSRRATSAGGSGGQPRSSRGGPQAPVSGPTAHLSLRRRVGAEPRARGARGSRRRAASSSFAQVDDVVATCSVPSRAIRSGHACRAIAVTDGVRPGRGEPRRAGAPRRLPPARQLALDLDRRCAPSPHLVPGTRRAPAPARRGERSDRRRGDDRLRAALEHRARRGMRRRSPSSSESTSSSRTSGDVAAALAQSTSASARTSASTAIRCSPCEPKERRSRPSASMRRSWRCGPAPVTPRSRSRVEPRVELAGSSVMSPSYASVAASSPSSAGDARRSGARGSATVSTRASTRAPRRVDTTLSVHGCEGVPRRRARADAAEACVSLADRARVLDRAALAVAGSRRPTLGRRTLAGSPAPPLTTARRSGVKTSVVSSVRRRSAEREPLAVQLALRASRVASLTSVAKTVSPTVPAERCGRRPRRTGSACASLRARGENPCVPTCSASSRFVLPGAVRTVEKDDSRLELELERGVRTEVAERDVADDQPARRMGMIRYQKLSSGEAMRPGRSGLMSLS